MRREHNDGYPTNHQKREKYVMSEKLICLKCQRTEDKEHPEAREKLAKIIGEMSEILTDEGSAIVKISSEWTREVHQVPNANTGWIDGHPCEFTDHYLRITTYRKKDDE